MITPRYFRCVACALVVSFISVQANPVPAEKPPNILLPALIFTAAAITVVGLIVYKFYKDKKNTRKIESEKIRFVVNDNGDVQVRATYRLQGIAPSGGNGNIFYPLPGASDSLICATVGQGTVPTRPVKTTIDGYAGYLLHVEPERGQSTTLSVSYVQKPGVNRCRYILLTTKKWKHPVGKADFTIALPKGKKLTECTYACDQRHSGKGETEYSIQCNELWPEKDLAFAWE